MKVTKTEIRFKTGFQQPKTGLPKKPVLTSLNATSSLVWIVVFVCSRFDIAVAVDLLFCIMCTCNPSSRTLITGFTHKNSDNFHLGLSDLTWTPRGAVSINLLLANNNTLRTLQTSQQELCLLKYTSWTLQPHNLCVKNENQLDYFLRSTARLQIIPHSKSSSGDRLCG